MIKLCVRLFLLILAGCESGGGSGSVAIDPGGFSEFKIENSSSYIIKVQCESISYSHCNTENTGPGEMVVVGEYGEIGRAPSPESVFDSITVIFFDGDESIGEISIEPAQWEVLEESTNRNIYSFVLLDDVLYE